MKHAPALLLAVMVAVAVPGGRPLGGLLAAQSPDAALEQAVDRLYPVDRLKPAPGDERHSCFDVLESSPSDEPLVVMAAYTDRTSGVVRVLRRAPGAAFEVAAESPDRWLLAGADCVVRTADLDFDGRQEAIIHFLGGRASSGWILKWDGALTSLTPTTVRNTKDASLLLGPVVYDLEHTGSLRVVASRVVEQLGPGQAARNPAFVYRLGTSGLEMERGILGIMGFRADVDPRSNERAFPFVVDSVPPWTIRVINGDRQGRNRVTGARIVLNGQEVVGPGDLHEGTEFVTKTLESLTTVNHLTATLTGPGEAFITVVVGDGTKR